MFVINTQHWSKDIRGVGHRSELVDWKDECLGVTIMSDNIVLNSLMICGHDVSKHFEMYFYNNTKL